MNNRAFTLIELLVVITILAILSSILFPVFGEAKQAAKGAASTSNVSQIAVANTLYANDWDDASVLNGNQDPDAPFALQSITGSGRSTPYKSWGYLLQGYMRNMAVLQDPLTRPEPSTEAGGAAMWSYKTQYGYAFTIHSPALYSPSTGVYAYGSRTNGMLAKPAETVLFVEKKARNGNPDWYWEGSTLWGANVVNPPGCQSDYTATNTLPQSLCVPKNFWGTGATSYEGQSLAEGGPTGGVAFRRVGRTIVTWADGHAKSVVPGALAAGTTWTKTTAPANVRVTDKERYVWDAD